MAATAGSGRRSSSAPNCVPTSSVDRPLSRMTALFAMPPDQGAQLRADRQVGELHLSQCPHDGHAAVPKALDDAG